MNIRADLNYLIENELMVVCPLISTDRFISHCRESGVATSKEQLEEFERLGLFYPFARVQYQKLKIKVEYSEDRQHYREIGLLEKGEQWQGDIEEEYAYFSFEKECAQEYIDEGLLWEPHTKAFQPWDTFIDEDGGRQIESFYSRFQIYNLHKLIKLTSVELRAEWLGYPKYKKMMLDAAKRIIIDQQKNATTGNSLPLLCQVISNRYFPSTQSDRRTITVSTSGRHSREWDWFQYRRSWDAKAVSVTLGLAIEELKAVHDHVLREATHLDPLEHWYDIVSFVSIEQRKRLKDKAALAQVMYVQEMMLRLFFRDITGEALPAPDESWDWSREVYYGKDAIENQLIYLELLTNKYRLNPKPRLILVVEGEGEFRQLPRLARELLGHNFPTIGIRIVQLEGVGGFTGRKRIDKYGALEKFIDDYHFRQTFVFVILDNEGRVSNVKRRLISAQSRLYPKRKVTKAEYIHIWQKTIEFDNFTHREIADAMSKLSKQVGRACKFEPDEVAKCEKDFGSKKRDWLSIIFKQKCGFELPKPELLKILFDEILCDPVKEFQENGQPKRPIVQLLMTIARLAGRNHQPVRFDTWKQNQESGYFGDTVE